MARLFLAPEVLARAGAPEDGTAAEIRLEHEPHRYLSRVLRLRAGDEVTVFDGAGSEIAARVVSTDARTTVLALGARRTVAAAGAPVILLQAMPKGERMDLLVQKTTELGVARVCPVVTTRTVVQPGRLPHGGGRLTRWRTIAQEAARQCGRADLPVIDEPRPLGEALRALGAPQVGGARLMAWEEDRGVPLRKALTGNEASVILLVGAEGGFAPEEAALAQGAGFVPVGLGPRILRSETAAIVAVALAQAALGALD